MVIVEMCNVSKLSMSLLELKEYINKNKEDK